MNDQNLEITEEKSQNVNKFILKGRVNASSADVLLYKLENALKDEQKRILVNMTQVEFLSSVGIRVILKIYKKAQETGYKFNIESPSDTVKNVIGMVALNDLLI
jgi:anti-anti-sigma factor